MLPKVAQPVGGGAQTRPRTPDSVVKTSGFREIYLLALLSEIA